MNDNAMLIPSGWMFKSPEELLYEYDPSSFAHTKDVGLYAFANTAYTIFTSKPPYSVQSYGKGITEIVLCGNLLERPAEIADQLWDLLQLCRSYRPEDRPSILAVRAPLVKTQKIQSVNGII